MKLIHALLASLTLCALAACTGSLRQSQSQLDPSFTTDAAGARADAQSPSLEAGLPADAGILPLVDAAAERVDAPIPPPEPTHLCGMPRPAGAPTPAPLAAYSGAACPALAAGMNTIMSSGAARSFILVVPSDTRPGERLPVSVLWHPLGSDADVFLSGGVLQRAADAERFIAILPQAKGDIMLRWPSIGASAGRVNEELRFFDDMLACVAETWTVNTDCIATAGVSAGALWGNRLANARADRLSSFVSVSGGSGGAFPAWGSVGHRLPAMVLWGGPTDTCGPFSFDSASRSLESSLSRDGHAVIDCVHNCGHALPPFESGDPFYPIVHFGLNHPFWLEAGETPYDAGLPEFFPTWCAVGAAGATPRSGMCAAPSAC